MQAKLISRSAFLFLLLITFNVNAQKKDAIYEIRTYLVENTRQEQAMDEYLKTSLLPAFKRNGVKETGVFKLVGNDTLQNKKIMLLIPYKNFSQFLEMESNINKDEIYNESAKSYLSTAYNMAPFKRIETVLVKAFKGMPLYKKPSLKNEPSKRVYELRSYESPTEELYARKVHMFNEGGEIALFDRLGFNAVFYGSVIAGSKMPNLMYMTSFEDRADRDAHWKSFSADEEWKKLAAMEFYKRTVSKSEIQFLVPTDYSDL